MAMKKMRNQSYLIEFGSCSVDFSQSKEKILGALSSVFPKNSLPPLELSADSFFDFTLVSDRFRLSFHFDFELKFASLDIFDFSGEINRRFFLRLKKLLKAKTMTTLKVPRCKNG